MRRERERRRERHTRKKKRVRAVSQPLLSPFSPSSEDARFVWKRLPPVAQVARPTTAAFALLQAMWARDLEGAAAAAAALPGAVGEEGPAAAGLVAPVRAALRSWAAATIARAYSRLPLARLAALLGCATEEEAAGCVREFGWRLGPGGEVGGLVPPPGVGGVAAAAGPTAGAVPSADLLDAFVDYVVELEA